MIPEGTYKMRPKAAGLLENHSGNEQAGIEFEFVENDYPPMAWYGSFASDAAVEYTVKVLRVCGWEGLDLSDLTSIERNKPEVQCVVEHETYEGKTRAKIKYVNKIGTRVSEAGLDPARAKAFAANMRSRIAALGVKPRVSQPSADSPF